MQCSIKKILPNRDDSPRARPHSFRIQDDQAICGVERVGRTRHRLDRDGRPWFLEAGLYCSFARQSVVSTMAAHSGLPLEDLFAISLRVAMRPTPAPEAR